MQIAFIRHGERRRNESDPALTSAGRRMASEAARWLQRQGFVPTTVVSTPTRRTRQTAEELCLVFPAAQLIEHPAEPEGEAAWEALLSELPLDRGPLVLVGHHPTVEMLLHAFGPPPVAIPPHHFASALLLEPAPGPGWRIRAAWPGRASS